MHQDKIDALVRALTDALRTDDSNATATLNRFVEMREGTVSQLMGSRHHLVVGRRGVGKTTLLQHVRRRAMLEEHPVAIVDLETHKGRQFPDVLVDILEDVLIKLEPDGSGWPFTQKRKIKKQSRAIREKVAEIKASAPTTSYEMQGQTTKSRNAALDVSPTVQGSKLGNFARGKAESQTARTTGAYDRSKVEELRELAPEIQRLLKALVEERKECLIFLDDFYFVRQADQPPVLDFLHAVVKGTGTWLKVGGVGNRMKTYVEGDPPVGIKEGQDVHKLKLDLTLEDFATAKKFLENVLAGILGPIGLTVDDVLTDEARFRLVIASGGAVSRDYLTLILEAFNVAAERRAKKDDDSERVRLMAEDITRAASQRARKKEEEELTTDAGEDAPELRARWKDIRDFAKSRDGGAGTAFILVKSDDMSDTDWGKEIAALEALRLVHRIGYQTPNTENWRGINCVVFTIDYGFLAVQRLTGSSKWDFWRGQREMDRLRRATWVYDPNWQERLPAEGGEETPAEDTPQLATLFDVAEAVEGPD